MTEIERDIQEFYATVRQRQPVSVVKEQVAAICEKIRTAGGKVQEGFRIASDPCKWPQNEIYPGMIYAASEIPHGDILFHLSDSGEDATAWPDSSSPGVPIEVTNAHGSLRYVQGEALNKTGRAHGFIDASDDDRLAKVRRKHDAPPMAQTSDKFSEPPRHRNRKSILDKEKHHDRVLVIYADLLLLPSDWRSAMAEISRRLPVLKFPATYVVGYRVNGDVCYRLN